MVASDKFVLGTHNVICDVTGRKYKASECRRRWDGAFVHKSQWEPRHPQDFLRAHPEKNRVKNARPETERFEQRPVTVDDL